MQALLDAIAHMPPPGDAQRIFHGRGGRFAGCEQWTLDSYPPALVLTSFAPATPAQLAQVEAALQACWARWGFASNPDTPLTWVYQERGQALRLQGESSTQLMAGRLPEPHVVCEDGARYRVQLLKGQNHGLFLDMAAGRRWVRAQVAQWCAQTGQGPKVLNLFAYSCAFSVAALQAGARQVVNVDMARGAIALGQHNHQLNALQGASFLAHDIFSSWGKITRSGPYGLVIIDPPSFQKGSFVATKDYARLLRRLPELLAPGGYALLCLNAPELGCDFLHAQMQTQAPGLRFVERVANPAVFADVDEERALKVLVYQAPA
ncbi:MAG: class I SAM-dependent methyltransferase [Comamonadaceae bacterium]|jgi:23S rRNA (cytosine1962-C5)-methyltransferase|nr:class I SAM-dependent methyltransferase [Comamonadaceae bacterium]